MLENKKHKPICIIPARGGSKRIPHKNIKNFCGKPIIAYSIQNALKSNLFTQVIVSTDDKKIAKIATQYGASVPFMRPSNLANDTTATLPVVAHALDFLRDFGGDLGLEIAKQTPVCVLYPTAPLIDFSHIVRSFELFLNASDKMGCEYVFFANELAKNPLRSFVLESKMDLAGDFSDNLYEGFIKDKNTDFGNNVGRDFSDNFEADFAVDFGTPKMLFKRYEGVRSQDLPRVYVDAGVLYWGRASTFSAQKPIFSSHSLAIKLESSHAQDIDTISDWKLARAKFLALQKTSKAKNRQNTKND